MRVGDGAGAELVGETAAVWVAADEPRSIAGIAAETGLAADVVAPLVAELHQAGWLVEARA